MAPFRNFLSSRRGPTAIDANDENQLPLPNGRPSLTQQRSNASSFGLKTATDQIHEYKLSDINDSGVYLPPSPTEKKSFWSKSPHSTVSSNHRSMISDNEPFSISRESFDSYRRSFDISARSPMPSTDCYPTRASLQIDSRPPPNRFQRGSVNGTTFKKPEPTQETEAEFEDVGLNDETNKTKKRGFLSRFAEAANNDATTPPGTADGVTKSGGGHFSFHITGRKRGQSGTGAELGNMDRPGSAKGLPKAEGLIK